jgi:KEOPS complex subunit Pcc1
MDPCNDSYFLEGVETELEFEFENSKEAEIVLKSIKPEINGSSYDRTSVNMNIRDNTLKIFIKAPDSASFRAALNSYLRWIKLSYDVINLKNEYFPD